MALPVYLAMTAAEVQGCQELPRHMAWMACHFSSYGAGLSNLPHTLPPDSLLILNDRIPLQGHDPQLICRQLEELAEQVSPAGLLLDFQRPENPETIELIHAIALPCPIAVTEAYAKHTDCAVFLDAPRAYHSLQTAAGRWKGRQLWLELSTGHGTVTVTKDGSLYEPETPFPDGLPVHREEKLHCSYCIEKQPDQVRFHFRRTADDLTSLLTEAQSLGIAHAIGLYQELAQFIEPFNNAQSLKEASF